jgi:hypothetical protein
MVVCRVRFSHHILGIHLGPRFQEDGDRLCHSMGSCHVQGSAAPLNPTDIHTYKHIPENKKTGQIRSARTLAEMHPQYHRTDLSMPHLILAIHRSLFQDEGDRHCAPTEGSQVKRSVAALRKRQRNKHTSTISSATRRYSGDT